MFGRKRMPDMIVVDGRPTPVFHTTRVEQKPHDPADAARLYGELLDKARAEIRSILTEELPESGVTLCSMRMDRIAMDMKDVIEISFKLNGRQIRATHEIGPGDPSKGDVDKIMQSVAESVAAEVMN